MSNHLSTGVIGVGSMGQNHARVFQELPDADLVGVADADPERARAVAKDYGTSAVAPEELLATVDAVSIAVPTRSHYETALEAIEAGVHVLVEKPFVARLEHGRDLAERARRRDLTLQVGHIERFNPAVRTLADVVPGLDVIAVDATRLGPPIERDIEVNPVYDLMIHDIDVIRSIVDADVSDVTATHASEEPYTTSTLSFENDVVGTLTASRVTQQKVRKLSISAREARVTADYIDQTVEIHRQSLPEYVEDNGDVRFRRQNVVEHPTVDNGEPLKAELGAFLEAAATGASPPVTAEDGLAALRIANRITNDAAADEDSPLAVVSS